MGLPCENDENSDYILRMKISPREFVFVLPVHTICFLTSPLGLFLRWKGSVIHTDLPGPFAFAGC